MGGSLGDREGTKQQSGMRYGMPGLSETPAKCMSATKGAVAHLGAGKRQEKVLRRKKSFCIGILDQPGRLGLKYQASLGIIPSLPWLLEGGLLGH